jgi:hypothetical protein
LLSGGCRWPSLNPPSNFGAAFCRADLPNDLDRGGGRGFPVAFLSAACPQVLAGMMAGVLPGGRWGCRGAVTGVWAGQAAAAGGPQAALSRFIHSCSRCQPSGRCRVRWPGPRRAVRAATSMRSRRSVAPRALAQARLARDPARSKLWLMAAQASQAALAGNVPEVISSRPPPVFDVQDATAIRRVARGGRGYLAPSIMQMTGGIRCACSVW